MFIKFCKGISVYKRFCFICDPWNYNTVYKTYTSHVRYLDSYLHSYTGFPVAHSQNQTPRLFLIWASRRTWQLSLTIDRKILILRLHCLIYIGHGQYNSVMCVIYSFGIRILYKIHYFVVYARVKCYHRNQGTALPWMSWYSVMMIWFP